MTVFHTTMKIDYVTLETPETTLEMIDAMHVDYDFQFQQPIFFYPSLQKT
jgi:hypothetical protein